MGRLLSIDYGNKRCGIAVTDSLQISINPLAVVSPESLINFLNTYLATEEVELLIIGWPTHKNGVETYLTDKIKTFLITFAKLFPAITIVKVDESFSSTEAKDIIFNAGTKKKKRRDKALVDQVSAVVLIKRYLEGI